MLESPLWQKKRLFIFERDNWTCCCCGEKTKSLHIHHWQYGSAPWEVDDDMLITVCKDCHLFITKNKTASLEETLQLINLQRKGIKLNNIENTLMALAIKNDDDLKKYINYISERYDYYSVSNKILETLILRWYERLSEKFKA